MKKYFFRSFVPGSSNEIGVRLHPVHSDWFENVQRKTIKRLMYNGEAKVYCNERESSRAQSLFGLVQTHPDTTESMVKSGTFVMYLVYNMLLNSRLTLRQKPISNED